MKILNYMQKLFFLITLIFILFLNNNIICRSHLRKSHEKKPKLEVSREKTTRNKKHRLLNRKFKKNKLIKDKTVNSKIYFIASNNLEVEPIFKTFDKNFFYNHMLPENIIYRYDKTKSITKTELDKKLQNLVLEIDKRKRHYKDFIILKQSDFNRKKKSGLLILKFKNYPFVVKMFIENPKNFVKPYSKGFCPIFFFNMGGGINRHLLGFTRIKNLENIQEKVKKDPKWSQRIAFPRKWNWVPKDPKNIRIIGKNFDKNNTVYETIIPGTYCIISDEIKLKGSAFSSFDMKARKECMSLCNFLDLCIDPHLDNFLLEKDSEKIALIDTENFRAIVGLKGKQEFSGYVVWIYSLAIKFINDTLFKPKKA
jgi:hypothetical protein